MQERLTVGSTEISVVRESSALSRARDGDWMVAHSHFGDRSGGSGAAGWEGEPRSEG